MCGVDTSSVTHTGDATRNQAAKLAEMVSEEEEWSIVQGALQILTVADCLTSRASVFEASLRATLARIGTSLSLSVLGTNLLEKSRANETGELSLMGKNGALDVAALHLSDMPEKAKKLLTLLEQVHQFANLLRIVQATTVQAGLLIFNF